MNNFDIRLGSYDDVLDDVQADLIFCSPPYNIGSKSPRRDGQRAKGKFDAKSYGSVTGYADNMPEDAYQDSQEQFFLWVADHLAPNGVFVYNHKPRRRDGSMIHPASWFLRPAVTRVLTLMEEVIWDRGSTHNHSNRMMWPTTERLYVFRHADGEYPLLNTDSLPYRSDVWRIPLNSKSATSIGHNVPMALDLADSVVKAWSNPGDLVCCPYTGSGTVGVAAMQNGRDFVGAELLPNYHEIASHRIAESAGMIV